jgi:hypothetical protein
MDESIGDKIKGVQSENREATFSLFTLSGHVISGRITAIGSTITPLTFQLPMDRANRERAPSRRNSRAQPVRL